MQRTNKKIYVSYVLLFAFIQFPFKLTGSLRYLSYVFVYGIPLVYLFCNFYRTRAFFVRIKNTRITFFKLIYLYLLIASIFWPVMMGTFDFSYLILYWSDMLLWLIKYTFLVLFFEKHIDNSKSIELFVEYIGRSVAIYVISSLIFCVPIIRNIMVNFIYLSSTDVRNLQRGEYYTRFGWSGWTSYNETAICSIAVLVLCILILKNNQDIKLQKHYLLLSIFPLIGNALFGRIGLFVSVVCIALTCFFTILRGNIKYLLIIGVIAFFIYLLIISMKERVEIFNSWYNWVFSAFETYRRTGRFYDNLGSVQHLTTDMYWMPELETFLLGDGYYTGVDGAYYMHTDSGIMRPMLFYGILNYIFSIVAMILLLHEFSMNFFDNNRDKSIKLAFILSVISVASFEFKGESLWMFISIILPVTLMMKYHKPDRIFRG